MVFPTKSEIFMKLLMLNEEEKDYYVNLVCTAKDQIEKIRFRSAINYMTNDLSMKLKAKVKMIIMKL